MSDPSRAGALAPLDVFIGEWSMTTSLAPDPAAQPRARTSFEWLSGRRFLIQRWQVEHPQAPDGIAIIGRDRSGAGYLQHYFDSRGVERTYEMAFAGGIWRLRRLAPAPDFSQRFEGRFGDDGSTIAGRWEHSSDGRTWQHDFDLTYTRLR